MSFGWFAAKARDPSLPRAHRMSRLRSCFLRLSWLTGEGRNQTIQRYRRFYLPLTRNFTEELMNACLEAMEKERAIILARLEEFTQKRIQEKRDGRRTMSKANKAQLDAILGLDSTPD